MGVVWLLALAFGDQMRESITISSPLAGNWRRTLAFNLRHSWVMRCGRLGPYRNIVGQILMDRSKQMSSVCGGASIHRRTFLERKEIINA